MPRAVEKGDILDLVVVNKKAAELSFGTEVDYRPGPSTGACWSTGSEPLGPELVLHPVLTTRSRGWGTGTEGTGPSTRIRRFGTAASKKREAAHNPAHWPSL